MTKTITASTLTASQASIITASASTITKKAIKTLASHGNPSAMEILNSYYHADIFNDLQQDVLLSIIAKMDSISIDESEGKLIFSDDETKKAIFQTVQHSLYQLQQKHYKHLFTSNNDYTVTDTIDADYAMYTQARRKYDLSIANIEAEELFKDLSIHLTDKQKTALQYAIDGYKQREIATFMNITQKAVSKLLQNVRNRATEYLKN